jgi:hypothetical protein
VGHFLALELTLKKLVEKYHMKIISKSTLQAIAQQATFLLHSLAQSQLNLAIALRRSNQVEMALNALNTYGFMPCRCICFKAFANYFCF